MPRGKRYESLSEEVKYLVKLHSPRLLRRMRRNVSSWEKTPKNIEKLKNIDLALIYKSGN